MKSIGSHVRCGMSSCDGGDHIQNLFFADQLTTATTLDAIKCGYWTGKWVPVIAAF